MPISAQPKPRLKADVTQVSSRNLQPETEHKVVVCNAGPAKEDHLAEDLSLSALASVACLSPYHFARHFKESTGLSPHQYVLHRRVERAKLFLATTTWSLLMIAHTVGFAHESHLALHFKRLTGLSPNAYAKSARI